VVRQETVGYHLRVRSPARPESATAFAPASVANVVVGFDVLGFAFGAVGDRVTVTRTAEAGLVRVVAVDGVVPDLPTDARRNTASVALLALVDAVHPRCGFDVAVHKGIPLGSGMGGSAASAVGAVVAANALLDESLPRESLLGYALAGEQAASGAPHADNAAPCLFGGLVAVVAGDVPRVVPIPVPARVLCVLVHPHLTIETRAARAVLRREIPLGEHVRQSARLAGFLAGCFHDDLELIARSMEDLVVEPQRAGLIPGFAEAKAAALGAGALGFGIAGSGPSVFAWVPSASVAADVVLGVRAALERQGLGVDSWTGPIEPRGAALVADR